MLLMVGKGIKGENVTLLIDMQKLIINTLMSMIEIKNRHILNSGI